MESEDTDLSHPCSTLSLTCMVGERVGAISTQEGMRDMAYLREVLIKSL